ncbi:MarR family transcriptional regulator [Streptomyces sp. NPDC048643]|uniref:MarR family transcriptional regulator n=1 Tax=Streptomyces sp. NPDC048643 TaxID=3155637 RepID=UPI0034424121
MSGIRDSLGRVGFDLLSSALSECRQVRATGRLRVSGRPGGVFHLHDGCVVAVESPGAPGPEARLLRSSRVSGEQWAELLREAGGTRWPQAGLIAHGYAGAAQLRVVCMMAMQDAAFAVVAGDVEACDPLDAAFEPYAPVDQGEMPGRLLQDAARKLAAVAALTRPVRPDRERPVQGAVADESRDRLPPQQRELFVHADGRRTARDIAFVTGLGVYTATVGMARLLGEGLLELPEAPASASPVTVRIPPTESLRKRSPSTVPGPDPELLSALAAALTAGTDDPGPDVEAVVPSADPSAAGEGARPVVTEGDGRPRTDASEAVGGGSPAGAPDGADPGHPDATGPAPALRSASLVLPGPDAPSLPRREPGASGITETLAPERAAVSWKGFFRLRHRIWTPDSGT